MQIDCGPPHVYGNVSQGQVSVIFIVTPLGPSPSDGCKGEELAVRQKDIYETRFLFECLDSSLADCL